MNWSKPFFRFVLIFVAMIMPLQAVAAAKLLPCHSMFGGSSTSYLKAQGLHSNHEAKTHDHDQRSLMSSPDNHAVHTTSVPASDDHANSHAAMHSDHLSSKDSGSFSSDGPRCVSCSVCCLGSALPMSPQKQTIVSASFASTLFHAVVYQFDPAFALERPPRA
jgi:hypothetical protein